LIIISYLHHVIEFQTITGLWVMSAIGNYFTTLNLLYIREILITIVLLSFISRFLTIIEPFVALYLSFFHSVPLLGDPSHYVWAIRTRGELSSKQRKPRREEIVQHIG